MHLKLIIILFMIFYSLNPVSAGTVETNGQTWTTDGVADQDQINEAIKAGDYIILSGDFCIDEPVLVDSGTTLDGQGETQFTLADNVNRKSGAYKHSATTEYANPMVPLIGQSDTEIENIEIKGISFDGNYNNNLDLIKGRGFYNIIFFKHAVNVRVHDNYFTNSHGDSCRMYRCSNIQYYNNEADHLGHEGLFCIETQNIEAWNNRIENCIDNSFRVNNCDNVLIHDNYITSIQGTPGSGPGIQVQQDIKGKMRVEICNNYIVSTWGPGIWIVGTVGTNEENDIYVHDNAFLGTGLNGITWVSGIIWSSMDNVRVENNVFDSCYGGGITSFKVKGLSTAGSSFEVTATHNIFTDIQQRKNSGAGTGYAFDNNLNENHRMISDYNVFWENEGNFKNVKQGANDLFQDPKVDSADTGWEWKNGEWYNEFVTITPGSRWNPSDDDTGEIEDDEDAPVDGEFDSIFDVLEVEFSDSGRTGQKALDLPRLVSDEVDGLIAGGVKIVITDIIYIDGVAYIPGVDAVQAQTKAILDPDLNYFTGHIKKIEKSLDVELDNGTAYAVFTVKTHWYTVKKNPVTGEKKKSKIKTSTSIFKDSCPVPLVMERPTVIKGILYEYPIHSLAYVPSNGLTAVEYEYDGKTVKHIYMIGEQNKNENGVIYTNFSKVNYWKGDLPHQGEFLFINGSFDPEKLTVTAYTPYESLQVIHFDYVKKDYPDKFYADWLFPSFGLFLILGFGAWYYIRKILY